jgi:hypothetical protein
VPGRQREESVVECAAGPSPLRYFNREVTPSVAEVELSSISYETLEDGKKESHESGYARYKMMQ